MDYSKYEGHTPGPWKWLCNPKGSILLESHKWVVMSFERWGMSRATPCFRTAIHLLEKAKAFFQIIPGEEHHASWNQQLVHPDAALIADAPALLARCKELEDQLSVENRHSYGLMQKRNELRVELEKLEAENAELRKRLERKDGLLKEAEAYISTDCSICTLRNSKVCEKSTDCKALELNMNILEEIERKP